MRKKTPHHWIAFAFLLIGGLLLYESVVLHWHWIWPASNCLWVGGAYYTVKGRVFGKRDDGELAPFAVFLLLPFLLINWATWYFQNWISSENPHDEVSPGLYFGRRPFEEQLPEGVSLVVDMTSEFANPGYAEGVAYIAVPTLDAFVPDDALFLDAVRRAALWEGGVFVNCANGHGRSALMVGAILMRRGLAKSVEEAEAEIVRARPLAAWHPAQRAMLERLSESLLA
jgi:protein-tyrosine phosphatase